MASASKTPNLNLPQWVGTEKPERTDFNAAFDAIDDNLNLVQSERVDHVAVLLNSWTGTLKVSKNMVGVVNINADLIVGNVADGLFIAELPLGYDLVGGAMSIQHMNHSTGKHGVGFYLEKNPSQPTILKIYGLTEATTGNRVTFNVCYMA